MPRKRERKTNRGQTDITTYKKAYDEVKGGCTLRAAAAKNGINYISLRRYAKKREAKGDGSDDEVIMGYTAHNRVLSLEQEVELRTYLMNATETHIGLSAKECRKLIFDWTVERKITAPKPWFQKKMAGEEWFRSFLNRQLDLSNRATSMTKKFSPNKTSLENLQKVMNSYNFQPQNMYNVMEIGITTDEKRDKVFPRNSGHLQSDRSVDDSVVTVAFVSNALGDTIPPLFVFPETQDQEFIIKDGPTGSIGITQPSGWINERSLLVLLNHLREHAEVSVSKKVLLIIDSVSWPINTESLDFCRESGIVLLSFPLHCSQKFQPLSRFVYESLRKSINTGCDTWNEWSEKNVSVEDIPSIVAAAMPIALTEMNIRSAFFKSGIFPMDANCFTEAAPTKPNISLEELESIINSTPEGGIVQQTPSLVENTTKEEPADTLTNPDNDIVGRIRNSFNRVESSDRNLHQFQTQPAHDLVSRIRNSFHGTSSSDKDPLMETTVKTENDEADQYSESDEQPYVQKDACDLFGDYVSEELRVLPLQERLRLQKEILNCITAGMSSIT